MGVTTRVRGNRTEPDHGAAKLYAYRDNIFTYKISAVRAALTDSATAELQIRGQCKCKHATHMHRTVDSSTVRERGRAARTISAPQRTTPSRQHPPTHTRVLR